MPTINILYNAGEVQTQLEEFISDLKVYAADTLSCNDIQLQTNKISIIIFKCTSSGMLANIELEITAHAFDERVDKQDQICLDFRKFVKDHLNVSEVRV